MTHEMHPAILYSRIATAGEVNLLVCGRCFSATHDAHSSCLSMAQTMAMGHAAGAVAAIAIRQHTTLPEVPTFMLQDELRRQGAVFEMPDHVADTSAAGWRDNRKKQEEALS